MAAPHINGRESCSNIPLIVTFALPVSLFFVTRSRRLETIFLDVVIGQAMIFCMFLGCYQLGRSTVRTCKLQQTSRTVHSTVQCLSVVMLLQCLYMQNTVYCFQLQWLTMDNLARFGNWCEGFLVFRLVILEHGQLWCDIIPRPIT